MELLAIGEAFALAFCLVVILFLWEQVDELKRHARHYRKFVREHEQCELARVQEEWARRNATR